MSLLNRTRLKASAEFSMSSIADIVFLLLIFFLLTSNFVSQAGVPVDLPKATEGATKQGENAVTIEENGQMWWNNEELGRGMEKEAKQEELRKQIEKVLTDDNEENDVITLRTDQKVFMSDGVYVINLIAEFGGQVFIATEIQN